MIRKSLLLATLVALLAAGVAAAQTKDKGPKLYRWVDKEGKIHYDQALPPEAVNEARREFNAKTGAATGSVDRALTPEEREQQALAEKAAIEAEAAANEQKRREEVMMASYETETELRRAYGERITLLETTIDSTDVSIRSLRENLATMLAQASETELENRRVIAARAQSIRELHAEQRKQEALQANRRVDLAALNAEFARMLTRYRELRGSNIAPAVQPTPAQAPASAQ